MKFAQFAMMAVAVSAIRVKDDDLSGLGAEVQAQLADETTETPADAAAA